MKQRKRITAFVLAAAMIFSNLPMNALAVETQEDAGGLCEHHTEHTADCGYTEGTEGTPCTHEHNEDCYTLVTECVHEHTEDCYPAEAVPDNTATPSDAEDREQGLQSSECTHECSEESGCITKALACHHEHDSECAYTEEVPGTPCTFVCEICNSQGEDKPVEQECVCETPCTAEAVNKDCPVCGAEETDLTQCKGTPAQEETVCICTEACTAEAVNKDCPVCGAEEADLSQCKGTSAQEEAVCICTEACTAEAVNKDCPVCGAENADLTQCKGKEADEQVKAIQEQINALPTAEEVEAMAAEEQQAVYEKSQAAYAAYQALTEEQKAQITGLEKLDNLFAFFAGKTNALATIDGVNYLDENGSEQTADNVTVVETGTTDWQTGWYVVNSTVTIGSRVSVSGDVHLILADGCDLTINGGIQVAYPNSLTIYGQSAGSGKLTATAPATAAQGIYHAAIGSSADFNEQKFIFCGSVTINGGTVTAKGADMSAGIGGGPATGGNIVINGGTVTATGGESGAGIGGGMQCNGGPVTINGGNVTAKGGAQAAGIGSGTLGNRIPIQINGGTVTATGGSQGAGIGDGARDYNGSSEDEKLNASTQTTVTITGGTVIAAGGGERSAEGAAGIGGGACCPGGKITISGGEVTATGANGASGIGHGGLGATGGEITISGGTVTAIGGSANPGISCKDTPTSDPIGQEGWILISGGTVYASPKVGQEDGPAIRGSFRTETNGNAFVVATGAGITDKANQNDWSGAIFDGSVAGKVYGNPMLETDAKIPANKELTIPAGSSMTVSYGTKLELTNSTVTINSGATLTNNGTIAGTGILDGTGTLTGTGTIENTITNALRKDSVVSVSVNPSPATYSSEVTITAQMSRAANTFKAAENQVEFFVGTDGNKQSLGTAEVSNNRAGLTITLSQDQGFVIGENIITAEFGGSMVLKPQTGSTQLTVKGNLKNAVVTVSGSYTYTGQAQIPAADAVTVKLDGVTIPGDQYTIAASNNTNAGQATVTVTGKDNYTGTASGTFTIHKATPTPTIPTGLTAVYGSTLKEVPLPSGWAWDAPTTSVGDVGENTFPATYTQDNSGNYNEVKQNLTVKVMPASYKLTLTGQADSPTQITLNEAVVEPGNTGTTVTYGYNTKNNAPDKWQTGRVFSGLTADTTYYFFAKAGATKNYAETISQGVAITTPEKPVSAIKITHQPDNLSYTSGQTLDLNGLSVQVYYNDNTNKTLTWASGKLSAAPAQGTALTVAEHNGKPVTISYGGKTAETSALTVDKAEQEALSIIGAPSPIYEGSSFRLQASGGSGTGAVSWSVVSGPVTVEADGTVKVTGAGEFQIKAVKAADVEYNQAEAVITLTAVKKPSSGGGDSSSGGSSSNDREDSSDKDGEDSFDKDSTNINRPNKNDPNTPTTGQTTPVKPGTNGNVNINESTVQEAIDKAVADAKKNGSTANGIAVVVPVNVGEALKDVQIILKAETLDKLVSSNVKQFTIDTDRMTDFGFTLDTLKELDRQTSGDIVLKVKKTAASSVKAKAAIGKRPAYDISLWEVKNSKETRLTNLNGKTIRMAIPYTPAKGEQTGNLYAVSVDAAGKVQWITKSSYHADQKAVIFEMTQPGTYGVGYDAKTPAFTDITNHWAKDNILFVVSRGLLNGTSKTTFSPNAGMTRGMFVTALGRLAGVDPDSYQSGKFTDVKADAYYAPYVNWAAKTGIVSGTTDTTFAPDSNINREQMAVIMKNYAAKLGCTVPKTLEAVTFADNASISSQAKEAVKSMQQAGILAGKTNNRFDPAGTATRAEVATVLRRFVEIVIDPQTANGWVPNDSGEWSYYKNGEPAKGWLVSDQKRYWLDKTIGKMFSNGWKQIDGKQYYFYADGSMAVNTTVDGKIVGADGARK